MLRLSDFDFNLPPELIASRPLAQRDASRMLAVIPGAGDPCDTNAKPPVIMDQHVRDFLDILRPGDVVVFNNSRVIPARFIADGKYEITLHTATKDGCWWGLCKKFTKLKPGRLLTLEDGTMIGIVSQNIESGIKIKFLCKKTS